MFPKYFCYIYLNGKATKGEDTGLLHGTLLGRTPSYLYLDVTSLFFPWGKPFGTFIFFCTIYNKINLVWYKKKWCEGMQYKTNQQRRAITLHEIWFSATTDWRPLSAFSHLIAYKQKRGGKYWQKYFIHLMHACSICIYQM